MAYSLQIEGQGTGGNSESTTTNWLKSNNLSHLIPIFKQNAITISELSEMPKDELTEMLQALGLDKINLPRVRSKIMKLKMKNNNNNNQYQYQQQQIPQKVIITEAETVALNSLDNKYKELSTQEKSIENRLTEFENEYIKQQKILNSTFYQIALNIEKRKAILLKEMKQKRDEYKSKLFTRKKSIANQRSLLDQIKNECETNINNSAVGSIQSAQKRANEMVETIDVTLLSIQQHSDDIKINNKIYVKFNIANNIHNDIQKWGNVSIIGDKPPVPKINIVRLAPHQVVVELLCDQNHTQVLSKYEYECIDGHGNAYTCGNKGGYRSRGRGRRRGRGKGRGRGRGAYARHNNQQMDDDAKQESTYSNVTLTNDENVAFFNMGTHLSRNSYMDISNVQLKIRGRSVMKNGTFGEWSEWTEIVIPMPQQIQQIQLSAPLALGLQKEFVNMNEWCQFCKEKGEQLSLYEQRRIFYWAQFDEEINGMVNKSIYYRQRQQQPPSKGYVRSSSIEKLTRLDHVCNEWLKFQKELKKLMERPTRKDTSSNASFWGQFM